ncbi:metallophosphoesterase [Cesiribacter sp. SM1]|uniref:metallophosphoesterase family protein n=1 Tax=Cesiribacter sp. SM1 TaxID=2861196 RepID=UPI001CD66FBE|nr:metallophosphoesterase [Cesiribacter sp. SM1]
MRVLIFGDVHGNLIALEKMLQVAGPEADMVISHGDVVNYGPWSNECVQLLESVECTCLMGNHETYYIEGSYPGENKVAKAFFSHCYPRFSQKELITAWGNAVEVGDFQVQHTVNNQYVFPDTDIDELQLERNYIIGHSHHQFAATSAEGKKLINTGSVGQNRKWINVINYVLYDTISTEVSLESVVYNVDLVLDKMRQEGYPSICLEYYQQKKRL